MPRTQKKPVIERLSHRGLEVKLSKLAADEREFVFHALDTAIDETSGLRDWLRSVTYVRGIESHPPSRDEASRFILDYTGSSGAHAIVYRHNGIKRPDHGSVRVLAGRCIDDGIAVLCHELTHAQVAARAFVQGIPFREKGEALHTPDFFRECGDFYDQIGCLEMGVLHDMLIYKTSRDTHMPRFPKHELWWNRMRILFMVKRYQEFAGELRKTFGPLEPV